MKLSEMLIKFRLLAQKMEMQTVLYILDEEIVELFNITIPEYARDIFSRKRNRELNGVSDNVVRLAELQPLYTNSIVHVTNKGQQFFGEGYDIVIPDNLMFVLNINLKFSDNSISDCRLLDIEQVMNTIKDYHSKPTKESPICYINGNNVEVITGTNANSAEDVLISYIKKPIKLDINNPDVGCELPDFAVEDIIKRSVNLYNAASDNNSYEKVAIETQKLE